MQKKKTTTRMKNKLQPVPVQDKRKEAVELANRILAAQTECPDDQSIKTLRDELVNQQRLLEQHQRRILEAQQQMMQIQGVVNYLSGNFINGLKVYLET